MSLFAPYKNGKDQKQASLVPDWTGATPLSARGKPSGHQSLPTPRPPLQSQNLNLPPKTARASPEMRPRFVLPLKDLSPYTHNMPHPRWSAAKLRAVSVEDAASTFPGPSGALRALTSDSGLYETLNTVVDSQNDSVTAWLGFLALLFRQLGELPQFSGMCYHPAVSDMGCLKESTKLRFGKFISATKDFKLTAGSKDKVNSILCFKFNGKNPYTADISQHSMCPTEQEVLIPPHLQFVVEATQEFQGLQLVTLAPCAPPGPGCHVMFRCGDFESPEMKELQSAVLDFAAGIPDSEFLPGPIYFETRDISAMAFLAHCEDDLEWKVVVEESCAPAFLSLLQESAHAKVVSVVLYGSGAGTPSRCGAVCHCVQSTGAAIQFINAETIFTPRLS